MFFEVVFTLGRMMTHCNYYGFYYKNAAFQSPETIVEMMLSSSSSSSSSSLPRHSGLTCQLCLENTLDHPFLDSEVKIFSAAGPTALKIL